MTYLCQHIFRPMTHFKNISIVLFTIFQIVACTNIQSKDKVVVESMKISTDGSDKTTSLKSMKASDILKKLKKGENIQVFNAMIEGDLDFTEVSSPALISPNQFTSDVAQHISFFNCVFMGKVIAFKKVIDKTTFLYRTRFGGNLCFFGCDFQNVVNFRNATINGDVYFPNCQFFDDASFDWMLINGTQVNFVSTIAQKKFDFSNTVVRGNISFMDAKFAEDASFPGLKADNLNFNNINVGGQFRLSEAQISGIVMFNYAMVEGETLLSYSKFDDKVNIVQSTFNGDFSIQESVFYGKTKMNRSVFKKNITTENAIFELIPEMMSIEKRSEEQIAVEVKNTSTILLNH